MTRRGDRIRRQIETEIEALGVLRGRRSRLADTWAYFLDGKEIVHFHGEREIGIRLTHALMRAHGARLEQDARVRMERRDWIDVVFAFRTDVPFVLDLVRLAIRAYR